MDSIDWRPKQPLPTHLPPAPTYVGEAFPDPVGPDSDNVVVAHRHADVDPSSREEVGMGLPWLFRGAEDSDAAHDHGGDYTTHNYAHRVESSDFNSVLAAAAQIARLESDMTLDEVGTVGIMQARSGAYYVAAGLDHDELNYSNLEDFSHSRRTHEQLLAVTDGTDWVDLRDARVGPPAAFGWNELEPTS